MDRGDRLTERFQGRAGPTCAGTPLGLLWAQLQPLVVPHDSQTKQDPAGRMRTPQVEQ